MDDTDGSKHGQFEAETGQEVPRTEKRSSAQKGGEAIAASAIAPTVGQSPINQQPSKDSDEAKKLCSEETTGQPSIAAATAQSMRKAYSQEEEEKSAHQIGKRHSLNFATSREELNSNQPMSDLTQIGRQFSQPQGDELRGIKHKLQGQSLMSSSLHSLPSSFSPAATPRSPHSYLGYNPLRIPELTMSQPNLPDIQVHSADRMRAREEVKQLRQATVRVCEEVGGCVCML